jgi:predicted nucleotidyltransferase
MIIKDEISRHLPDFIMLFKTHNVKYLYAFGSAVNDKFDSSKSDIDLLIEIDEPDPIKRGEKLFSIWDSFESLFNRKVDLLTDSRIRNPYLRKSIDATKVLIYDGKKSKILI